MVPCQVILTSPAVLTLFTNSPARRLLARLITTTALPTSFVMKLIVTPGCLHFRPFVRQIFVGESLRFCTTGGWKSPGAAPTVTGLVDVFQLPAASVIRPAPASERPPASPGFHGCDESRYTREPSGATAP